MKVPCSEIYIVFFVNLWFSGLVLRSRNELQFEMNNSDGLDIDPVD